MIKPVQICKQNEYMYSVFWSQCRDVNSEQSDGNFKEIITQITFTASIQDVWR